MKIRQHQATSPNLFGWDLRSAQVVLQECIDPLSLSFTLWMKTGEEVELRTHELKQLRKKSLHEASVPVDYNGS